MSSSPGHCFAVNDTVIPANHQGCINFSVSDLILSQNRADDTLLFEPNLNALENIPNCVIAKSIHSSNSGSELWCNVINAGDDPITIKKGQKLGTLCEAEEVANEEFEKKLASYKPLDFTKLEVSRLARNALGNKYIH